MTEAERLALISAAEEVRDETTQKANTALRVGGLFRELAVKAISEEEVIEEIEIQVPISNPRQFSQGSQTSIETVLDQSTSSVILFVKSQTYASEFNGDDIVKPLYAPDLTFSRTNAKHENRAIIHHSGLVVPSVLVPNKPSSPLPIYDDEAAMLANQASQVNGEYYEYTGSTSMWLYNGVANGLIGDYTELEEIAGWEEWGAKPEWLIVTGTYLVGADNRNIITATYYFDVEIDSVWFSKVVVADIKGIPNGNMDATIPDIAKAVDLQFNDNSDLSENPNLNNDSIYNELIEAEVLNPSDAIWNDLTGGNYSLQTGNDSDSALRSYVHVNVDPNVLKNVTNQKITIIARFRKRASSTTPTSEFQIFGNSKTGTKGFNFSILFGDGRPQFYVGSVRVRPSTNTMPVIDDPLNDSWHCVALTYDGTLANTYYKSSDRSVAFSNIGLVNVNDSTLNANELYKDATFELNRVPSSVTEGNTSAVQIEEDRDVTKVWFGKCLTSAEVEAEFNIID